jgi:hypothetical protein
MSDEFIQIEDFDSSNLDSFDIIKSRMDSVDPIGKPNNTVIFTSDVSSQYNHSLITKETLDSITDLYKSYNAKYGLSININTDSIMDNFKSIIDPNDMKVFEIYLAEAYGRFRLVIYQKLMITISALIDDISKPMGNEISMQDRYIMIEKLLDYLSKINAIHADIKIGHADSELKRLSSETNSNDPTALDNNEEMNQVLKALNKTILKESSDGDKL